jgi:hypothetical protein
MTQDQQEYMLGRNVTERAQAKENRGTVVLSLRLSSVEFDMLTDRAESQRRTVSQVAREAIQGWLKHGNRETQWAALSFANGPMVYFGNMCDLTFRTGEPSVQINQDLQESEISVGT